MMFSLTVASNSSDSSPLKASDSSTKSVIIWVKFSSSMNSVNKLLVNSLTLFIVHANLSIVFFTIINVSSWMIFSGNISFIWLKVNELSLAKKTLNKFFCAFISNCEEFVTTFFVFKFLSINAPCLS